MNEITHVITDSGTISAFANGRPYIVATSHPNYDAILEAIKQKAPDVLDTLYNVAKSIETFSEGNIRVENGEIYFGQTLLTSNKVSQKILNHMKHGLPFEPLVRFLDNLMQNPSKRAVDEAFDFLQHHGLPITDDGYFLAYKRVRKDYTDCYSGKFDNKVGQNPKMLRNEVDDNWGLNCSQGFHVGSMEYVRNFHDGSPIMIVKVNPKDIVTVPSNECTKCRVCEYKVVDEYKGDLTDEQVYKADSVEPEDYYSNAAGDPPAWDHDEDFDESDYYCEECGNSCCICDDEDYEDYEEGDDAFDVVKRRNPESEQALPTDGIPMAIPVEEEIIDCPHCDEALSFDGVCPTCDYHT